MGLTKVSQEIHIGLTGDSMELTKVLQGTHIGLTEDSMELTKVFTRDSHGAHNGSHGTHSRLK